MFDIRIQIGGQPRAASNGASFERRNPLNEAVATRAPAATPADAVADTLAAGMLLEAAALTTQVSGEVILSDTPGSLQSGICRVNGPTVHGEAQMPFGGVKDFGCGRFGATPASRPSPNCAG